jgi:hypothetical protein
MTPTQEAIDAAVAAAKAATQQISSFVASEIPADDLSQVITAAFTAGLNVLFPPKTTT